jgi:hypothetical protein
MTFYDQVSTDNVFVSKIFKCINLLKHIILYFPRRVSKDKMLIFKPFLQCLGLFILCSINILFLYQVFAGAVFVSSMFKCCKLFIYTIIILLTRFPDIKLEFIMMSMLRALQLYGYFFLYMLLQINLFLQNC